VLDTSHTFDTIDLGIGELFSEAEVERADLGMAPAHRYKMQL
jgi:hypothetical protein